MISIIKLTILGTASFLLVFFGAFFFIRLFDKFKNLKKGFFHLLPYIILLIFALGTISSGRNIAEGMNLVLDGDFGVAGWVSWVQKITTLVFLLASLERITNGFVYKRFNHSGFWPWFSVLFIFWFTTVFSPAVFSDHPHLSHEYFYPLIFFIAALFLTNEDKIAFIYATRNALIGFILLSWLFVVLKPSLVFELDFAQGFIPGLPRFAGVAPHAVVFASLALMTATFLFFIPVKNSLINRFLWVLILLSIFLAQSKTVWIISVLFFVVYYVYIEAQTNLFRGLVTKKFITRFIPIAGSVVVVIVFYIVFIGIDHLISSDKLSQLESLTGRDMIWATILEDSKLNSIFGYGPDYFADLRTRTGLLFITHGHNQFFDTLARSGEVGIVGLLILNIFLVYQLIRTFFSKKSLFVFFIYLYLFVRMISEIPITFFGYSLDIIFFLVLVMLLKGFRDDGEILKQCNPPLK